ncbi:MAG: transglycosylase domain-containing protein, partial [Alphaproteobacteria bacterium]
MARAELRADPTDRLDGRAGASAGRAKARADAPQSAPARPRRRVGRFMLKWGFVAAIWLAVAAAGSVVWLALDLPDMARLVVPARGPSVVVVAGDGTVIGRLGSLVGRRLDFDAIDPDVVAAVLAVEDRRFFAHEGVDVVGLGRALVANVLAGRVVQGGSTITQQLAKNLFLGPERTFTRKARELVLALRLEHTFTKREILALYLNRAYFGAGAWGIDAAARRYFNRSAGDLTLAQAAMLAGLLRAPSRYAPTGDLDAARARRRGARRHGRCRVCHRRGRGRGRRPPRPARRAARHRRGCPLLRRLGARGSRRLRRRRRGRRGDRDHARRPPPG